MRALQGQLQAILEGLYRIETMEAVADYCLDREYLICLMGHDRLRESLLVHNDGAQTDIGLYIAEESCDRAAGFLNANSGQERLERLDDFCVAFEGVSHFVYFTFCGNAQDRPVSRIELELQAEVDKFIYLRTCFALPDLIERLFERFELSSQLSDEEKERYQVANTGAKRYARWLDREFSKGRGQAAMADARKMYRRPLAEKLERIARAA